MTSEAIRCFFIDVLRSEVVDSKATREEVKETCAGLAGLFVNIM